MAKNKQNNKNKQPKSATPLIETNKTYTIVEKIDNRKDKSKEVGKQILILCEGETEENYFEGINNTYTFRQQPFVPTIVCPPTKKIGEENDRKNQPINLLATTYEFLKLTKKKRNEEFESYCNEINTKQQQPEMQELRRLQGKKPKTNFDLYDNETIKNIQNKIGNGIKPVFDELWLIFDDDDRSENSTSLNQIFHFAKVLGIEIAFSNRQWENWILLHFEKTLHTANNSGCKLACVTPCVLETNPTKNCIIGYLEGKNYHSKYQKGHYKYKSDKKKTNEYGFEGLFEIDFIKTPNHKLEDEVVVFDKIQNAIENAAWLRQIKNEYIPTISTNPYTDVDKLITNLLAQKQQYIWGTPINICHQNIICTSISFDKITSKLIITIENKDNNFHLVNKSNLAAFTITAIQPNSKRYICKAIEIDKDKALQNSTETFEIIFEKLPDSYISLRLNYKVDKDVVLITEL